MASSSYELDIPDIGPVKVTKKSGLKSVRLQITAKNDVLVSAPNLMPKVAVVSFILSKKAWIIKNRPEYDLVFYDGMMFGKNLELKIIENRPRNRSKLTRTCLQIYLKNIFNLADQKQKIFIEKAVLMAMKHEAEVVLLPILHEVSKLSKHNFNQAYVKNLKSRWGSCDRHKNIILNIYMLQLPEELIEYVILHELTHTVHLNHSAKFWLHLEQFLPNYKELKKELHKHQPRIEIRNHS